MAVDLVRTRHGIAGKVNLKLVSDEQIQKWNSQYKQIDSPTDVLTFPAPEFAEEAGDVAIAIETAERQAASRGIPIEQEIALLAIHGALHLAGFDDVEEADREQMLAEMSVIAKEAGIPMDPNWSSLYEQGQTDEHA